MEKILEYRDVYFKYENNDGFTLKNISCSFEKGEFALIVGSNGSGKSTFSKLSNGLLIPTKGDVFVDGMNTKNKKDLLSIRQKVGLIFQNPENQFIASTVEEDVAFGPSNLKLDSQEVKRRVKEALDFMEITNLKEKNIHSLSLGQKQRVAIAGVLAMKPGCIIMDEPMSMLDPEIKYEILKLIKELCKSESTTVILITHFMEDINEAEKIIFFNDGQIQKIATPNQLFEDLSLIENTGLKVPNLFSIIARLRQKGIDLKNVYNYDDLIREIALLAGCKDG